MENKNNNIKTISIPLNNGIVRKTKYGNEGQLDDLMNLRPDGDSLVPVQRGTVYSALPTNFTNITIHKRGVYVNHIAFNSSTREVLHYEKGTGATTQLIVTLEEDEIINDIKPFLNYLIISTSTRLLRYLFYNNSYTMININLPIKLSVGGYEHEYINSDIYTVDAPEGETLREFEESVYPNIKGYFYSKLNEQSELGRLSGGISYRVAYKLIDGSYLMTTTPRILTNSLGDMLLERKSVWTKEGLLTFQYRTKFKTNKYKVLIDPSYYDALEQEKDIIHSIVVFFSKPILREDIEDVYKYKADNEGILYDINVSGGDSDEIEIQEYNLFTSDYINIGSPLDGWFQICEIPFYDIIEKRIDTYEEGDKYVRTESFYSNYANRISLPVDQLTHHELQAGKLFLYNSRLWLTNLNRTLANPFDTINVDYEEQSIPFTTQQNIDLKIVFRFNINNQVMSVIETILDHPVLVNGDNYNMFLPILSYPDQRAYEVSIYAKHEGVWKNFLTEGLTVSTSHNFSYFIDLQNILTLGNLMKHYSRNMSTASIPSSSLIEIKNKETGLQSQVQLSELNNPLIFPTSHNYNVGTGEVLDFGVTSDAISEGQFGQFPVYIFTTLGIYAAEIGTGTVVITSVKPIGSDVLEGSPVSTKKGVFFPTSEGIMVINGREVTNTSFPLNGRITPIVSNSETSRFNLNSTHAQIVQLGEKITVVPQFDNTTYDYVLGYDHVNKRLLVTKSTIGHSYVLDLKTMKWYRISEGYNYFVDLYPDLLGVTNTGNIINVSFIDHHASNIQVHFHTRALNFNVNNRKKMFESLLRCNLKVETSRFASFAVFASNDNEKWTRVAGNDRRGTEVNDIKISYCPASYKYFIFAFWAELKSDYDNYIEAIDAQLESRYDHRL